MVPYRQEQSTSAALAKLEARPVGLARSLGTKAIHATAIRTGAPVEHCMPSVAKSAADLGLLHLGALSEAGRPREVWVDSSHTFQLHASRTIRFVATYFDDGSCILTFGHSDPVTRPTHDLAVFGGIGSVEFDLLEHEKRVARWIAERNCVPLRVDDVETAARMVRLYYRYIVSASTALPILTLATVLIAIAVAVLIRTFAR